jgi:glycerate kinase
MRFDEIIAGSDLVITGEGRLDAQTVMGKAPSGVLSAARRQGIPCIAIGGGVRWCEELRGSDFAAILPIVSAPMALEEAMRCDVAAQNVERTAQQVGRMLKIKLN